MFGVFPSPTCYLCFITSVLIKNYISTGIIRGFKEYKRIQEGQLRIYLVLNLTKFSIIGRGQFKRTQLLTRILRRILLCINPNSIRSGRNSNNFWTQVKTFIIGNQGRNYHRCRRCGAPGPLTATKILR